MRGTLGTPSVTDGIRCARNALRFLRARMGGEANLASALKVSRKTLDTVCAKGGRPSAGLVIRAARVAGASVEELLSGHFPAPGVCPYCGRAGD
jgi:CI repressor-like protein